MGSANESLGNNNVSNCKPQCCTCKRLLMNYAIIDGKWFILNKEMISDGDYLETIGSCECLECYCHNAAKFYETEKGICIP